MAKFICEFEGVRGRVLKLYDNKLVIITKKTIGSFITGNITDGEKTIFLSDIVGVQFKKSGLLIGYLQFETPSLQMNNKNDNMFSENTFTFEVNKNGITNELIESVYSFIVDRIEEIKYGLTIVNEIPNFEGMKSSSSNSYNNEPNTTQQQNMDIDYQCHKCGNLVKYGVASCVRCNQPFVWENQSSSKATSANNQDNQHNQCPNCKEILPPGLKSCPICHQTLE